MTDLITREESEMTNAFIDPVIHEYVQVGIVRYNAMLHTELLLKERIVELERFIDEISDFFRREMDRSCLPSSVCISKDELIELLGLEGER